MDAAVTRDWQTSVPVAAKSPRGPDVEDELARLLAAVQTGAGNGGNDADSVFGAGSYSLLWVAQQHSLRAPTPDYDLDRRRAAQRHERASLQSAIAGEVDAVAGGALARRVAERVREELSGYIQAKRKEPKKGSRYDTAIRLRNDLAQKREHARKEAEAAAERLQRLAARTQALQQQASPELLARLHSEAEDSARLAMEAEKAAAALAHAKSREEASHLSHLQASERLKRFGAALDEVAALADERARVSSETDRLLSEQQATAADLQKKDEEIAALDHQLRALAEMAAKRRERAALAKIVAERDGALKRARSFAVRIGELQAAVAHNPATPERMRKLYDAAQAVALADERASVPSVALDFALDEAATDRVKVNGTEPHLVGGRIAVDQVTRIEIEGIGWFEIVPADAQDRAARLADAASARGALERLESELGARVGQEAGVLAAARQKLVDDLVGLKAHLAAEAPKGTDALAAELERDRTALAALDCETEAKVGGRAPANAKGDDEARIAAALQAGLAAARDARDDLRTKAAEATYALGRLTERKGEIEVRIVQLDQELGEAVTRSQERDRLATAADEAGRHLQQVAAERAALAGQAPRPDELAGLIAARTAAQAALKRAREAAERLGREVAELEGEVRAAGEAEIGPLIVRLDGEIAALDEEIAHHRHEVAALELLHETLAQVASENQARFLEPVERRLAPYLAQVFPDAEVVFNEGFGLEAVIRGGTREAIDVLSDGTREQLAVLVRLGFARLFAERGLSVPVILDDALVYSDDERIKRMFAILQDASDHHQVIVFTCRAATFAPLEGVQLAVAPWPDAP